MSLVPVDDERIVFAYANRKMVHKTMSTLAGDAKSLFTHGFG